MVSSETISPYMFISQLNFSQDNIQQPAKTRSTVPDLGMTSIGNSDLMGRLLSGLFLPACRSAKEDWPSLGKAFAAFPSVTSPF